MDEEFERKEIDYEFSEGFMKDMANLLVICANDDTDCLSFILEFPHLNLKLNTEVAFSIVRMEEGAE